MDRFPIEFEQLLNRRGRQLLADPPRLEALVARRKTPIVFFENVIDPDVARECMRILDEGMYPALRRMHTPIAREAVTEMTKNYSESLKKTVRVRTATFNSAKSKALDAAREIGLADMMWSDSWQRAAQAASKAPLKSDPRCSRQVICYEAGDYSGPHNDHHPENENTRNGFHDFHVMFSNDAVASQLLVYEERYFLTAARDVSGPPSIAVYRLPFWHYTTPLMAKPGREREARRWLLLGSFDYDPPLGELRY